MNVTNITMIVLTVLIMTPFVLYFCGKWFSFGWFNGKRLAERSTSNTNNDNVPYTYDKENVIGK